MKKNTLNKINIVMFFITLIINYLIATSKFPGLMAQKVVSNMYDTSITPIGFTFSIWGVIYLLLFLSLVWMYKQKSMKRTIGIIILFMMILNIMWNVFFGLRWIGLSVVIIVIYWLTLILIVNKLKKEKISLSSTAFGLHLGWITIATVVNIYAYLVKINFEHLKNNADFWTILGITVVLLLTTILTRLFKNFAIPLVIAWAIFGIYAKDDVYITYTFIPNMLKIVITGLIGMVAGVFVKNR
ncbi:TspO/MBR family protein [Streptobacillus canis]|uniref:TspO/MBR family protein n=1 Tax=Streptobacillus canis TaxID=2678686 RepID=UPI0012E17374|nr:TspO/MBR family protein [Streptobacillus canis]